MKKNLITSLKKLYAAFGGKDPTKDNAVDIVDKIADSVDNSDFISYEDWQKEDNEFYLFPNGREGFSAIPVTQSFQKNFGEYLYISETGTNKSLQTGWQEYFTSSSVTFSSYSIAINLFRIIRNLSKLVFLGGLENVATSTDSTNLNTEIENLINNGYLILSNNTKYTYEFVCLGGTQGNINYKARSVFELKKNNDIVTFGITFYNFSDKVQKFCEIQYDSTLHKNISWKYNNLPDTIYMNSNLNTNFKNTYFKYDEDGYFTLAPDNKAEKALVVTITENNNTFTADKTYAELYDAFLDRQIFCLYNGNYYSLTNASSTRIFFTDNSVNPTSITISNDNSITIVE